ncbi:hypothetical protein AJ88_40830 [Mesorhizobium amorphae CCBAU 01583]|nr:hypothetical protein AJ88_40830 [Mesorhizobium amorphae CCBAU 01583]
MWSVRHPFGVELSKCRIDCLEHLNDRRQTVVHFGRDGIKLSEVYVACLQRGTRQPHAEMPSIGLEGDCSDQNGAQPKESSLFQSFDYGAGECVRRRQTGVADEGRNQLAAALEVALDLLEGGDPFCDLGVFGRADVSPCLRRAGFLEVPVVAALYRNADEVARRREIGLERGIQATLHEFGVHRAIGEIDRFHG